jgi:hypothetical protein
MAIDLFYIWYPLLILFLLVQTDSMLIDLSSPRPGMHSSDKAVNVEVLGVYQVPTYVCMHASLSFRRRSMAEGAIIPAL